MVTLQVSLNSRTAAFFVANVCIVFYTSVRETGSVSSDVFVLQRCLGCRPIVTMGLVVMRDVPVANT